MPIRHRLRILDSRWFENLFKQGRRETKLYPGQKERRPQRLLEVSNMDLTSLSSQLKVCKCLVQKWSLGFGCGSSTSLPWYWINGLRYSLCFYGVSLAEPD